MLGLQLTEKYRPTCLDDVIGIDAQKAVGRNFIKHWVNGRPYIETLLFIGQKGTGKTSLAEALGYEFGLPICETDAGNERRVKDIQMMEKGSVISSLSGGLRLIVVDEVDSIPKKAQLNLIDMIERTQNPIIFIANDARKLDYKFKKSCHMVKFVSPSYGDKLSLVKKINKEEGLGLKGGEAKKIVQSCTTMRQIVITLQSGNLVDEGDVFGTEEEQVKSILSGEAIHVDMKPHDLAIWIYDNSHAHSIVSDADRMLGRSRRNYNMWRYTYALLGLVRSDNDVQFPYSFSLIRYSKQGRPRRQKEQPKKVVKVKKTNVMDYKNDIYDESDGLGAFFV